MIIHCPLCKTSIELTQGRFSCKLCKGESWFNGTFQDGQINSYGIYVNSVILVYSNVRNRMTLFMNSGKQIIHASCPVAPHPDTLDKDKIIKTINRLLNLKAFI